MKTVTNIGKCKNMCGIILTLALTWSAFAQIAIASDYTVDQANSSVSFKVRHMMISTVRGRFDSFKGGVTASENGKSVDSLWGTIDVGSINTGSDDRDRHLVGEDFFETDSFPSITFRSVAVNSVAKGFVVELLLTMHGITKNIHIPMTIEGPITDPWGNERIAFSTIFQIDRTDFGILWNDFLDNGGLVVSNEITIECNIEAVKL